MCDSGVMIAAQSTCLLIVNPILLRLFDQHILRGGGDKKSPLSLTPKAKSWEHQI